MIETFTYYLYNIRRVVLQCINFEESKNYEKVYIYGNNDYDAGASYGRLWQFCF